MVKLERNIHAYQKRYINCHNDKINFKNLSITYLCQKNKR